MTTITGPVEPGTVAELDGILTTHRAQLFGHLARYAASHHLSAADVAALLGQNVDTVRDWEHWAAQGPACTCTSDGHGRTVPRFDCPIHGDVVYRNPVRCRLMAV